MRVDWPDTKEEVPPEIRNSFHLKEELTIQGRIPLKGNPVIVPAALRSYMLKFTQATLACQRHVMFFTALEF